ncbi:hypothetical protein H9643_22240 [Ochrobactrum sp. Sa2BUA5]|uniref:Uncharacterized protein n=1 Tax=Ochrobactrum quorumnocens TaxID=271865 RepID=A0A5N1JLH5_9HYPH|nr:hypothetical protein [[Ochrobactrum] quorumnocens]KAA9354536.1 hypothetical protein F3W84_22325 [[Ochrobactrum] quorumnocens]MBD7993491.1 hypothetical protein [Ochrobactrum gallinarum]
MQRNVGDAAKGEWTAPRKSNAPSRRTARSKRTTIIDPRLDRVFRWLATPICVPLVKVCKFKCRALA